MANIRNSISLTDRMTPTLRAILKSMDSTLRVMKNLDKASNNGVQSKAYRRAEKDIKRANNQLIKMGNYTRMVDNAATRASGSYNRLGTAVSSVGRGMQTLNTSSTMFLQSLASGVYLAQKLAKVVSGVMTTSDTSRSQVARLGLYNTSAYSNQELYGQVFSTAMMTRSDLTDTADLVNKLLISGVYSGKSAAQAAIGTAGIINRALIAGGGTSEENARALKQLTQGLASGVLQGDELRSIREQTPYFAQVLAEGLSQIDDKFKGIGIGDLKELGAEGELTAERIVKAMWAMQDEINEDFKAMPKTFGQAVTSLGNIWEYFLFLLSGADGPLGKINEKLWQFVDYLQSPQGLDLMNTVAIGINFISTAISGAMAAVGNLVTFLQENAPIAQALFIALGTAAAVAGTMAFISWVAATWPMLLIIAVVGLVAWAFLDAGYTADQVVGAMVGGILWLGAVIWDGIVWIIRIIMWVVWFVLALVMWLCVGLVEIVLGIVQVVIWAVMAIITVLWFIFAVIKTVFLLIETIIRGVIVGVVGLFYGLAQTVLGIMNLIAQGIDAVFGSELSLKVSEWQGSLEGKFTEFVEEHGPQNSVAEIGDVWKDFGAGVSDMFTNDDYNLYGEMGAVLDFGSMLDQESYNLTMQGDNALSSVLLDPNAAYDTGYNFGAGIVDEVGDLSLGIPDSSVLDRFNSNDVEVTGGYLDGIKSDVDISDEDVQLLRDMAAREYLLQLQTITPVANVSFGDVRETADVGKIVEVIEQMVEEQMATSLVS